MITVELTHLDGTIEERQSTRVPSVLVRPNYVVFIATGPRTMRELGPDERVISQMRPNGATNDQIRILR